MPISSTISINIKSIRKPYPGRIYLECDNCRVSDMRSQIRSLMDVYALPGRKDMLPLGYQALVREGTSEFTEGEMVVHIGPLEPLNDLLLRQVEKVQEGWITLDQGIELSIGPKVNNYSSWKDWRKYESE